MALSTRWPGLIQWLPAAILICIALNQQRLAYQEYLSPWSGGGFGMFSTTDAPTDRHMNVYVVSPALRRELVLPESLQEEARRALALPTEYRLEKLAALVRATANLPSDTSLEIHVWATRYDPRDLTPESYALRRYREVSAR